MLLVVWQARATRNGSGDSVAAFMWMEYQTQSNDSVYDGRLSEPRCFDSTGVPSYYQPVVGISAVHKWGVAVVLGSLLILAGVAGSRIHRETSRGNIVVVPNPPESLPNGLRFRAMLADPRLRDFRALNVLTGEVVCEWTCRITAVGVVFDVQREPLLDVSRYWIRLIDLNDPLNVWEWKAP